MDGYDHGVKVPMDRRGSLPVSSPRAVLILLATNCVFLVRSAQPLMPSPQACLMTWMQLQQPSIHPTQESRQLKRQYLHPFVQLSSALDLSPSLHSMQMGAQHDQQHPSQQRYANPQAYIECHWSIQQATLQAAPEKQQHWQHFFKNYITTKLYEEQLQKWAILCRQRRQKRKRVN